MGNYRPSNVVDLHPPHRMNSDAWHDRSLEKLSSGLRIDRTRDHTTGLLISEEMKADILALGQETLSAVDQFSLPDPTADSLREYADILACVKDLSARVGALQQRLETTIRNVDMTAESLSAANTKLRDVDVAMETFSASSIVTLKRTGRSLLSGGGVRPRVALSLLRS